MAGGTASATALGFLTVVEHALHGLCGGYLLLGITGRPLEFHCTAPVKANRAQQILYGPTLEPYLYGEQIGATLVSKGGVEPLAVLVDLPALLAVRQHTSVPAAMVIDGSHVALAAIDAGQHSAAGWLEFTLGNNRLAVAQRQARDRDLLLERCGALPELFDLAEPFGRIREAIEEAQRGGAKAA